MRSERVVQVDGFLCKAPDLLQTFVFCTKEPSVLERIVHPLGQSVVQWVSGLRHTYLYSKRFEFVNVLIEQYCTPRSEWCMSCESSTLYFL